MLVFSFDLRCVSAYLVYNLMQTNQMSEDEIFADDTLTAKST